MPAPPHPLRLTAGEVGALAAVRLACEEAVYRVGRAATGDDVDAFGAGRLVAMLEAAADAAFDVLNVATSFLADQGAGAAIGRHAARASLGSPERIPVGQAPNEPTVHYFTDTRRAYDASQCDPAIKDGDVLYCVGEDVAAVMVGAWPTAIRAYDAGCFHSLAKGAGWRAVPSSDGSGGTRDYAAGFVAAYLVQHDPARFEHAAGALRARDAVPAGDEPAEPSSDAPRRSQA